MEGVLFFLAGDCFFLCVFFLVFVWIPRRCDVRCVMFVSLLSE